MRAAAWPRTVNRSPRIVVDLSSAPASGSNVYCGEDEDPWQTVMAGAVFLSPAEIRCVSGTGFFA